MEQNTFLYQYNDLVQTASQIATREAGLTVGGLENMAVNSFTS